MLYLSQQQADEIWACSMKWPGKVFLYVFLYIYIYVALTGFNEDVPGGLDENDPVFWLYSFLLWLSKLQQINI